MTTPRKTRVKISDLRQEIAELRSVGAQMSNVCFNWSQSKSVIDPDERAILAELSKRWDAIKRRGIA